MIEQLSIDFNPKLTREELLMNKLGLKPWKEFMKEREEIIKALLDQVSSPEVLKRRRSGRTTKMMLQALMKLEDGEPVTIIAHSIVMINFIEKQLRVWAYRLNIKNPSITTVTYFEYNKINPIGSFYDNLFQDHVVTEGH